MKHETHHPRAGASGGPFGDRAAVAIVGDSRPDVAREALKIARVESQSRPVLLVDLLGQDSALDQMFHNDDPHGVSDAARYGVSLARVARPVPDADGLFVISGGAETPLADDVLSDHLWRSWSDQCRRAGALLVVAAPADLPAVGRAIDQLDGMVMIGDAALPITDAPLIGRVAGVRRRAPADVPGPSRKFTPAEFESPRQAAPGRQRRMLLATLLGVLVIGAGATAWWVVAWKSRSSGPTSTAQPIVMPGDPVTEVAAATVADAPAGTASQWSVAVTSVNTMAGAMALVRQSLDSLPVPTFAASQPVGGSAVWYRLLAGAFTTSASADSLLSALRARGALGPAAGRVVQTPLTWQLEEAVPDDLLPARLFAWRQQGLPAYALIDAAGVTRVYVGAFETDAEARLFAPVLDSLNLYATLVTRIGSIR